MTGICLVLPMPPSVNRSYANLPGKGRIKTAVKRQWDEAAGWDIKRQVPGHKTIVGDVAVDVVVQRKRTDLDNIIKSLLDILTKMRVWVDDKQVVDLHLHFGAVEGVRVTISEVTA